MSGRYIFKFATKKAGCKGPDSYNGDVVWDESDGPVHLKFWSGKEYVRLSDMVRNEVDKYMKETNRMNDRPTPETDAAAEAAVGMGHFMVDSDFARKLERERDEAREAAAKWESSFDAMERAGAEQARRADENREWALRAERERDEAREALRTLAEHGENEIQKLIKECDEARNKMADALQEVDLRTLDYERMKQERDEAREQLAAAKHFLEKYIAERDEARIAIISTLEKNRHLADGDDCTLAKLKSVVPEWK